ncbi:MAG TPA: hypothetical protein VFA98_16640 [Thermoanaerobaculia bacterium]|nr:hypothetical protein [Thermoanaerobaculia bacterium]
MTSEFKGDPSETTLKEAQEWLLQGVRKGVICPCCTQHAKVYSRTITNTMAYALILIERFFRRANEWLHVPSYLNDLGLDPKLAASIRGDWTKLRHWGLIEEKPEVRDDGSNRAGFYKITQRGVDFVHDRIQVRKFIYLYGSRVLDRPCDETISIGDALGEKFHYRELMDR